MTLISSISGIRGTIGGNSGEALTPIDIVKYVSAFGTWMLQQSDKNTLVLGRDARISGPMVKQLVTGTLMGLGINVIDIGLATTPTVEMAVPHFEAGGGIILTASHNPKQWNALKLLNGKGEFISAEDGQSLMDIISNEAYEFADVDNLGGYNDEYDFTEQHIQQILDLPMVDVEAIKGAGFKVVIDCVNSVGGIALPPLLAALGVEDVVKLYCEPTGQFPHNPEPLAQNLGTISEEMKKQDAHVGFVVDPDVDRLAIINEDGSMFGEEYTLVAIADYLLQHKKGPTVSNLSSSRALRDVTVNHGQEYHASAVGEVNVVTKMKEVNAVIGGEGNGGIIYPPLHFGRDALVGIALFLTHLAKSEKSCSMLRASYPNYIMSKNKVELTEDFDVPGLFNSIEKKYHTYEIDRTDGLKIDMEQGWVHLRTSNTEPIIRIYAESDSDVAVENMVNQIKMDVSNFAKSRQ